LKKAVWIFSVVLTIAFTWQLTVRHVHTHLETQNHTEQLTTTQEAFGANALKADFKLPFVCETLNVVSFNSHAITFGNRLVDVEFIRQFKKFIKLKPQLFSPTFLLLRVLRL